MSTSEESQESSVTTTESVTTDESSSSELETPKAPQNSEVEKSEVEEPSESSVKKRKKKWLIPTLIISIAVGIIAIVVLMIVAIVLGVTLRKYLTAAEDEEQVSDIEVFYPFYGVGDVFPCSQEHSLCNDYEAEEEKCNDFQNTKYIDTQMFFTRSYVYSFKVCAPKNMKMFMARKGNNALGVSLDDLKKGVENATESVKKKVKKEIDKLKMIAPNFETEFEAMHPGHDDDDDDYEVVLADCDCEGYFVNCGEGCTCGGGCGCPDCDCEPDDGEGEHVMYKFMLDPTKSSCEEQFTMFQERFSVRGMFTSTFCEMRR